jgi:hypothetical protein
MAEKNHQNAIQDNNQFPAITAHSGTAGTAETVRLTATSDGFLNVNSAAELTVGTIARVSTIGTLEVGTVTIGAVNSIGTILNLAAGSVRVTHGTITDGTLPLVTTVTNLTSGSVRMTVGTLTVMPNIPGGTLGLVSSVAEVANVATGTIAAVTSVTNVANLAKGTVSIIESGTIGLVTRVGNVGTVESGSVMIVDGGGAGVNIIGLGADGMPNTNNQMVVAATSYGFNGTNWDRIRGETTNGLDVDVTRVQGGSIVVTAGTVVGGSIAVTAGTVVNNAGTMGKFDPKPNRNILTTGTTTAGTIGTLVAAPSAGSSIWITALDISQVSGTAETVVSFNLAASGAGIVSRGLYAAGGGIAKSYVPATNANNTGTALTFNMLSGSGTVSYNVHYFIDVP